jgi:hypothetical protein
MQFRKHTLFIFLLTALLGASFIQSCKSRSSFTESDGDGMDEEDPIARQAWEMKALADPATGKIPDHIRAKELAFASTLPASRMLGKNGYSIWQSRGPINVGGRTRAIAIDVDDENVILAGSVSGGIWRSTDGGAHWQQTTGLDQLANITCIVQNTNKGHTQDWFAGTGEYIGNSPSAPGAFFFGDGMLKSTDGGRSWKKLASTSSASPQIFNNWDIVNNVAVYPSDTGEIVFAATFGGIVRSDNGGDTWTRVRGFGLGQSTYTDVAITRTGIVYAALSSDGSQKGLWRSIDGKTWAAITPTGFASNYNRVVIGASESDPNQVYFLGQTPNAGKKTTNFQKTEEWNSLWKYTYISGDSSGTGGSWNNLSPNIPATGGDFGNFNSQGGYDLLVRVKPDDPNVVFIGGTNLWRSSDAFTTSNNISWIGGYGVNTKRPNYQMYPNQHPDEHNLIFYRSDPKRMISTCDGGIFRSEDNTAASVVWSDLNRGYITSQFYTVTIDHGTPGDEQIMGGLQDNGTFLTHSRDNQADWVQPFTSDGSYCAITNGRTDYYVSSQLGKTYHLKLDNNGKPVQFARVDPASAKVSIFVNPYVLDPNNQKRMYYIGKDRIWRNDDVTQIPMHAQLDTVPVNTGWSELNATVDASRQVTTLVVSSKPADRLYYGTDKGRVYRMDNASGAGPTVKDITGPTFPGGGYVFNIAIDPNNADHLMAVFSNYAVQSVFYSANGGTTWSTVSGNLEQNANGSGDGPSCRWGAIMPVGHGHAYFVTTSTGVYSTDTLLGTKTVWKLQGPDDIGNRPVYMIDTRPSDGLVVVATHGGGVYSANVDFLYQISGIQPEVQAEQPSLKMNCYPNPAHGSFNLQWETVMGSPINIDILDEQGRFVKNLKQSILAGKGSMSIDCSRWASGIYYCRMYNGSQQLTQMVVVK